MSESPSSTITSTSPQKPDKNDGMVDTEQLLAFKSDLILAESIIAGQESNNHERKAIYARIELFIPKLEKLIKKQEEGNLLSKEEEEHSHELSNILSRAKSVTERLDLKFVNRSGNQLMLRFLFKFYQLVRLAAVWGTLIFSAVFISLPCLVLLLPLDQHLVRTKAILPSQQLVVRVKRWISYVLLSLSGVELVLRGNADEVLEGEGAIVCFSHASTLDAFILGAALPVRSFIIAKHDLFLIPFFSWSILLFGAIPVNRNDRKQAVQAIRNASRSVRKGGCVSIAPEGTRSKSGQIAEFKKGPFYMWEELKHPIVPLVIDGAFDLLPPQDYTSQPGRVYATFLSPIYSHEANTRDQMSDLLRRRMLEAVVTAPSDAGSDLSYWQYLQHFLHLLGFYLTLYLFLVSIPWQKLLHTLQITPLQLMGYFAIASTIITLLFYIFLVYISPVLESATAEIQNNNPAHNSETVSKTKKNL